MRALLLVAALAGCTLPAAPVGSAAVERAAAAYGRASLVLDVIVPLLPVAQAAQVRAARAAIEAAIVAARLAATPAEELSALARAEAAMRSLTAVTNR